MALFTIIAGPYTATWSAVSTGTTEDGFRVRHQVSKLLITGDAHGDSVIDGVYRGGNVFISFTGLEYNSLIAIFNPYGAIGIQGQVGRLDFGSSISKPMILTAVAGTTAVADPATLTASESIISENSASDIQYASRNRTVAIEMRCILYDTGGAAIGWFTTT